MSGIVGYISNTGEAASVLLESMSESIRYEQYNGEEGIWLKQTNTHPQISININANIHSQVKE